MGSPSQSRSRRWQRPELSGLHPVKRAGREPDPPDSELRLHQPEHVNLWAGVVGRARGVLCADPPGSPQTPGGALFPARLLPPLPWDGLGSSRPMAAFAAARPRGTIPPRRRVPGSAQLGVLEQWHHDHGQEREHLYLQQGQHLREPVHLAERAPLQFELLLGAVLVGQPGGFGAIHRFAAIQQLEPIRRRRLGRWRRLGGDRSFGGWGGGGFHGGGGFRR